MEAGMLPIRLFLERSRVTIFGISSPMLMLKGIGPENLLSDKLSSVTFCSSGREPSKKLLFKLTYAPTEKFTVPGRCPLN
ncbi:hypothetical protein RchiOBHm_Chr1g0331891 [Rosa chinensis]|uniref:Uncharacterized protein n=1 Tax=Rosa chinensis TaxID=74649 RepID=A0A2P6SBP0_ROSCH|nr:hypothetical protein RchiOBHm_Chr1g0331891 [Rosa chinensis]